MASVVDSQAGLRKAIRLTYSDQSLTQQEKNSKVTSLLQAFHANDNATLDGESLGDDESATPKTYFDVDEKILGCPHYRRNCHIYAECCKAFFPCRLCHDEKVSSHKYNRYSTKYMKCLKCSTVQPVAQYCSQPECQARMGSYFCSICKYFNDTSDQHFFHCSECGLCRIGNADAFFHCPKCNICINKRFKNTHKCIERALESNCPICLQYLFESVQKIIIFNCGHAMHCECFTEYAQSSYYRCPVCSRSVCETNALFARIDTIMEGSQMPEKFSDFVSTVLCNDCLKKSIVPFHFAYHKCSECHSYNTSTDRRLHRHDPELHKFAEENGLSIPSRRNSREAQDL